MLLFINCDLRLLTEKRKIKKVFILIFSDIICFEIFRQAKNCRKAYNYHRIGLQL